MWLFCTGGRQDNEAQQQEAHRNTGNTLAAGISLAACGSAAKPATVAAPATSSAPAAVATTPAPVATTPAPPVATTPAAPAITTAEQQAIDSAQSYLSMGQGFSQYSLTQQLTSSAGDGFAPADAQFAINYLKPDWDAQAVDAAKLVV
jgi:hypothetical protein